MTLVSIPPPYYGTVTHIIKSNTVTTGHDDMSPTFTLSVPLTAEEAVQRQKQSRPAPKKISRPSLKPLSSI